MIGAARAVCTRQRAAARTRRRTDAAARNAADEAERALDGAIGAVMAQLEGEARAAYDALMRDDRGVSAHDMSTRSASYLHDAILVAAANSELREQIPALLSRAITHQRHHLRKIAGEAHARPRGGMMTVAPEEGTPGRTQATEAQMRAQVLMNDLLNLRNELIADSTLVRVNRRRRARLIVERFNLLLGARLGAGDLHGARCLLDSAAGRNISGLSEWIRPEKLTTEHLALASRIVRAHQNLGVPISADRVTLVDDPRALIARHQRMNRADIAAERAAWAASPPEPEWLEPAPSVQRALATAFALARAPERFNTERAQTSPPLDGDLHVKVHATLETLGELLDTKTSLSRHLAEAIVHNDADSPKGQMRRLSVELRYAYRTGNTHRVVSFVSDLGRTTAGTLRDTPWMLNALTRGGADAVAMHGVSVRYDGDHVVRTEAAPMPADLAEEMNFPVWPPVSVATDREALDVGDCAHTHGHWVPQHGIAEGTRSPVPVVARLRCDECLRSQVAVAPLHRFSPEHPMRAHITTGTSDDADADDYVRWRAFYDTLDGKEPVADLAALIARDETFDPSAAATDAPRVRTRRMRTMRDPVARR